MISKNPFVTTVLVLALIVLASCLKTVSNGNSTNPGSVTFINMAPAAPYFQTYIDGDTVGSSYIFPYANGFSSTPLSYKSEFAGIHSISIQDASGDTLVSGGNVQFAANTKYSVYLFDTLTAYGLNAVQLQDSYDSIPYGYCLLRFLNFSPNSPPLNLIYNDSVLFNLGQPYAYIGATTSSATTLSTYTTMVPGYYDFLFQISGTTMLQDSVKDTLVSGHAYTLFITGLIDSTGNKAFVKGLIHMN